MVAIKISSIQVWQSLEAFFNNFAILYFNFFSFLIFVMEIIYVLFHLQAKKRQKHSSLSPSRSFYLLFHSNQTKFKKRLLEQIKCHSTFYRKITKRYIKLNQFFVWLILWTYVEDLFHELMKLSASLKMPLGRKVKIKSRYSSLSHCIGKVSNNSLNEENNQQTNIYNFPKYVTWCFV